MPIEREELINEPPTCKNLTSSTSLSSATSPNSTDLVTVASMRKKSLSSSSLTSLSTLNIESINQTEACVFYVLSQLSHNDKPSPHMLAQFDAILVCLLTYLKRAKIRNPRALRILNRLTKNPNCFQSFIMSHFPYKMKRILSPTATTTTTKTWVNLIFVTVCKCL